MHCLKTWSNEHFWLFSSLLLSFCWGIPECAWAFCNFHTYGGKNFEQTEKWPLCYRYQCIRKHLRVKVLDNFPEMYCNRKTDEFTTAVIIFRKAALHSASFPLCLWNIKTCLQVKACICVSHNFSYAWDFVQCCGMQGSFKEAVFHYFVNLTNCINLSNSAL